jgi:methionine-rich copper-binding protein CopC
VTAYGLLASLAWTAPAVLLISKADAFAHRWLDEHSPATAAKEEQIPDDLTAFAMLETEKWAQDSVLKVIRERYVELKNWNAVRAAVGVASK